MRINVSQGPKPIAVPPVVGAPYEQAAATLQGAGFAVARRDVDSNEPKGVVVQMDPAANTLAVEGLDDHAVRLEGADGVRRPGRDELQPGGRDRDAPQLRLQGRSSRSSTRATRPRTGSSSPRRPGRARRRKPGTTVTITVGRYVPADDGPDDPTPTTDAPTTDDRHDADDDRPTATDATTATDTTTTTRPRPRPDAPARRGADGRPLVRARDLARLGAVGARGARPGALRRRHDRDRPRRPLGASPRTAGSGLGPGTVPGTSRPQLPVPAVSDEVAATLGDVEVVLPILHGPFGEDGTPAGPARAGRRRLRRRRPSPPRRSAWTRTCSRR